MSGFRVFFCGAQLPRAFQFVCGPGGRGVRKQIGTEVEGEDRKKPRNFNALSLKNVFLDLRSRASSVFLMKKDAALLGPLAPLVSIGSNPENFSRS